MAGTSEAIYLADVPFHRQQEHHCGPASLLTVLEASGVKVDYDAIVERVYVPGLEGSLQAEMTAAARGFGRIAYVLPPDPAALVAELGAGRPVLVLLNLGLPRKPVWHYSVVVGIDPERNRLLLRSGGGELSRQRASSWLRRWNWAGRWAVVLLEPGEWPAVADRDSLLRALAAFEDVGDSVAVVLAWKTAVEHWPDEPLVWLGWANGSYRLGDLEAASDGYRRVLALVPDHLPGCLNLAMVTEESGRPCEALRLLGTAPEEGNPLSERFSEVEERLQRECRE
jgi:hypothetical protein